MMRNTQREVGSENIKIMLRTGYWNYVYSETEYKLKLTRENQTLQTLLKQAEIAPSNRLTMPKSTISHKAAEKVFNLI